MQFRDINRTLLYLKVNESTKKYSITKRPISTHQKSTICPRKSLKIKKFDKAHELPKNLKINSTLKDHSPIMLPKKIGVRLFSLGPYLYFY